MPKSRKISGKYQKSSIVDIYILFFELLSMSKNETNQTFESPDISTLVKKGRGAWWWPKGERKRTTAKIQKELDEMYTFCFHGVEAVQETRWGIKKKVRIYPIFLYELASGRGYTRKAFRKAVNLLDEKKYGKEKSSFCATIEAFEEAIESRLFRKWLEWSYNPTITKLWLTANHGWVTDRTENKNDNQNQEISKEDQDDIDLVTKENG